jgi:D-3-phosphoglycerate dehydrogenase
MESASNPPTFAAPQLEFFNSSGYYEYGTIPTFCSFSQHCPFFWQIMNTYSSAALPVVLILDGIHAEGVEHLKTWAKPVYDPARAHWRSQAREAEGLIVRAPIGRQELEAMPALRAIVRCGAGTDGIPLDYAASRGIVVSNTPGANADSVAEYVFAALLQVARPLAPFDAALRSGDWERRSQARQGSFQLKGCRLGILGMGHIGERVARIGHAGFGMPVQATVATPRALPDHIRAVDLRTLCATSDCLAICCSLTDATRGLIGAPELGLLKPGGVLVNVARGAVIDEAALAAFAADTQRQTTLVLDVFHRAPLPEHHALAASADSLLTPHLAGITRDAEYQMGMACATVMQELLVVRPS